VFHELPEFIKTVPTREQPDYIMERLMDCFSSIANNDATSYEAHFTKLVMENIEFQVYNYMCSSSPLLMHRMKLIEEVLTGPQHLIFKYFSVWLKSLRESGEMNTSLGNGVTTDILVLFLAWIRMCLVKLSAEGDDNISAWQFEKCVPTVEDWKELGWNMKVERPDSVCTASFCGNVFDQDEKVVIVDPREALINFGWVRKNYVNASDSLLLELLRSKALSMAHQYNGCPILGKFGRHVVALTDHIKVRKSIINTMSQYDKEEYLRNCIGVLPPHIEPGAGSRFIVEKLYGISITEQLAFEASIDQITLWSCVELNFVVPNNSVHCFENYTAPRNESWVFPGVDDKAEVERVLRSFGDITSGFTSSFYR